MNTSLNETKGSKNSNAPETIRCAAYVRTETGDEGLERSLTSRESDDPPATRLLESMIRAFLQFQREQDEKHMARSEVLLHGVDLKRNGVQ